MSQQINTSAVYPLIPTEPTKQKKFRIESPLMSTAEIIRVNEPVRFSRELSADSTEQADEENEVASKITTVHSHDKEGRSTESSILKPLASVEWAFDVNIRDVGAIDLAFPENPDKQFTDVDCLPLSYYTLSAKERLLLVFAENFRRQFVSSPHYAGRRPIVLAPKNECGVQKFVCTTIRPTSFLIPQLIGSWEACASFVADFIVYEHLAEPLSLVDLGANSAPLMLPHTFPASTNAILGSHTILFTSRGLNLTTRCQTAMTMSMPMSIGKRQKKSQGNVVVVVV